jgi:hypothetical protein
MMVVTNAQIYVVFRGQAGRFVWKDKAVEKPNVDHMKKGTSRLVRTSVINCVHRSSKKDTKMTLKAMTDDHNTNYRYKYVFNPTATTVERVSVVAC